MGSRVSFLADAAARLSRRELLQMFGVAGGSVIVRPFLGAMATAQASFDYPFTLGVASGEPLPDGVVLWTRLAPRPLEGGGMPMSNVEVRWELASDPEFRKIVRRATTVARPELGHSVHVEVSGLEPAREYWYRFQAGGAVSPSGRTKTAPQAGAPVDQLRFAICGCSYYEAGYFTAYRHIAEEHFDFVFHTGDYIYEGPGSTRGVRQHQGGEAFTVEDYRNRYAQYKMDADLRAAHASAPFIVTWDDHEVDNNYAGEFDERNAPVEVFLLRRAAAYQAYYEAMPLRRSTIPAGPGMQLFRRLQFGRLIDLSVLDTRQWRSNQACNDGGHSQCAEALDPKRTMFGAEQEQWLFRNLAKAQGTWTILGQQVPTFANDIARVNPNGRFWMDLWDGYPAARQRLYTCLHETKTPNPIILSGDVHQHYGADLKLDFTDPHSATVGVELTNTSISSGGDGSDVSGDWERTKSDNPHIKYHSARRGYIACTATPRTLTADFKILAKVTMKDQPARIGGTLVVEAGRTGVA